MKHILIVFTLSFTAIFADIIETSTFSDLLNHITEDTLVVLDIDDTLLLPKQTLGNDVWFCHRWKQYQAQGLSFDKSLDKALADWEAIRHLTDVKLVEEGTDQIVLEAKAFKVPVMALTTQGLALATRTIEQLKTLNIDLKDSGPSNNDCYFMNEKFSGGMEGVLYRKGILFTSGSKKGKALITFLRHLDIKPKHVLFINDKRSHLKDVEEDVEEAGIRFTGLRYNIGDERVKAFNPALADIQWLQSTFDRILSDEEAARLLLVP